MFSKRSNIHHGMRLTRHISVPRKFALVELVIVITVVAIVAVVKAFRQQLSDVPRASALAIGWRSGMYASRAEAVKVW